MMIECTQCQSDILTEADPYLYQNTANGVVFICMDCVKANLNNKYRKALEEVKEIMPSVYSSDREVHKIIDEALKNE